MGAKRDYPRRKGCIWFTGEMSDYVYSLCGTYNLSIGALTYAAGIPGNALGEAQARLRQFGETSIKESSWRRLISLSKTELEQARPEIRESVHWALPRSMVAQLRRIARKDKRMLSRVAEEAMTIYLEHVRAVQK